MTPSAKPTSWSAISWSPLPDGLMFLVPTKLVPTAFSPLFSFPTKARMALELLHPPRRKRNTDESVASLVTAPFRGRGRGSARRPAAFRYLRRRRRAIKRQDSSAPARGNGKPIRLSDPRHARRASQNARTGRRQRKWCEAGTAMRNAPSSPPCGAGCSSWWTP